MIPLMCLAHRSLTEMWFSIASPALLKMSVRSPYFGINGVVTFKNARLRDVLPAIGLDRILLETDSPYLAPVPHRGKRNESAYLVHTAAHIASSLGLTMQEVDEATTQNAEKVFRLNII